MKRTGDTFYSTVSAKMVDISEEELQRPAERFSKGEILQFKR